MDCASAYIRFSFANLDGSLYFMTIVDICDAQHVTDWRQD